MAKKILLVVCLVVAAGLAYWLVVPPAEVKAPRPEWTVVEGPQNSWHDYHKLAEEAAKKDARPNFDQLVLAAKKPGSQRFYKPPVVSPSEVLYNYRDEKTLGKLASQEVVRLTRAGQLEKALALALATYEMGTDIAEPGSDLTPALVAVAIRREVRPPLVALLEEPRLTLEQAQTALAQIKALDARMPLPGQVIGWDREALARGLEEGLGQDYNPLSGLRMRTLNSVQTRLQAQQKVLSEAMDSWDPEKVAQAQVEAERIRTDSRYLKEAIPTLDTNLPASQRQFYLDRVAGFGLECQAALAVYARQNKQLPAILEGAVLQPPKDPRTGKPPRYKVDEREAVVLYPGPDGQDDDGREQVDPDQARLDKGRDQVFLYRY